MSEGQSDIFATTRWTVVLAAAGTDAPGKEEALATLCRDYWKPVYVFVRHRGHSVDEALDLTQEFFSRLLEKNWLAGLTREGGGFRGFLLTMLKRFLCSEHRRDTAAKRGGGRPAIPIDDPDLPEPACPEDTPELAFDRRWALTVLDRAVDQLRQESAAAGKSDMFEALSPFLSAPPGPGEYETVAARTGLTPAAVAMAVLRLRHRCRDHIRAQVAETLTDPAQADHEMRELLAVLRGR